MKIIHNIGSELIKEIVNPAWNSFSHSLCTRIRIIQNNELLINRIIEIYIYIQRSTKRMS